MTTSGLARAFERGLRAGVATMLLAIAGAILFPQSEGERLATSAYLAAIFAAVMLMALRSIPSPERSRLDRGESSVEGVVAFWIVVAAALAASASAAGSLDRELLVFIASTLAVLVAAVFPVGLLSAFAQIARQELSRGGALMALARYAVLASFAGWLLAVYAHIESPVAAAVGFALFALVSSFELAKLRPVRDVIVGTTLATVVAFAIAGCVPAFAESAAAVGYAAAVCTTALLVYRERYA